MNNDVQAQSEASVVTPDGMGEERKVEEIADAMEEVADASFLTPPKVTKRKATIC